MLRLRRRRLDRSDLLPSCLELRDQKCGDYGVLSLRLSFVNSWVFDIHPYSSIFLIISLFLAVCQLSNLLI